MRLKKLTIYGFKSFADKTTLHFDSGISCIVGPNGCGKSNISDAFRWVLGEQSAKSMRGAKMPDVIFAGSNFRKPLNYAEVSLTLNDVQGSLPIDYEEVTITRRLHRSGESEYLLNGNPVRLKDLQSLFLDSGIGRNAFSIFEQGKLDQVISFSPLERRHIFEEAAGILRFLQRKKESLKRLEQADSNLCRVLDIHREVQSQISALEEQAQQARQFKENQSVLEKFEKTSYVLKWKAIEKKCAEARSKEEKKELVLEEIKEKESDLKTAHSKVKQLIQEHDLLLRKESDKILTLKGKKELETREIRSIKDRLLESGQRSKKLKLEFEELTLGRQARQKMLIELENKHRALEMSWENAESQWKEQLGKVKVKEEAILHLRKELTLKQQAHLTSLHQNSQFQSDLKQIEVRIENQKERYKSLQSTLGQMVTDEEQIGLKVQERRQNLQNLSGLIDAQKERLEQFEEELTKINQELEGLKKELEKLKRIVIESKARQHVLIRMREEHEGFSSGSKRLLKEAQDPQSFLYQMLSPLYEFFVPEPDVAEALSVVLKGYSQTLVIKTKADWNSVVSFAEQEGLQDYSLICLENLIQYTTCSLPPEKSLCQKIAPNILVRHFLESIVLASTHEEIYQLCLEGKCFGGWSSQGIFVDHQGVSFKNKPSENQVFLRESELKKIEEELQENEHQLDKLEEAINRLQQKRSAIQLERSEVDKMLRRDEMKLVECNFALQKAVSDLEKNKGDQQQCENEMFTLEKLLEENNKLFNTLEIQWINSQQELIKLHEEKEVLQAEVERQETILKIEQQEQSEKNTQYQQLAEDRQQLLHQRNMLEVKEQDHDKQVLRIQEELEELEERSTLLQNEEMEGNSRLSLIEALLKESTEIYADSEIKREEIASQLKHAEAQWSAHLEELKKIENELNHLHILLAQYEAASLGVQGELADRFNLTIEDALKLGLPLDQSSEYIEKEIRKLRQALEDAGDVNLSAIEDLEKHQVRFSFIKQQMEDMSHSKEELLGIIRQLEEESRSLFRETFEAIRANFKKNFQILFNGGEADLQFTDSEDILEAGIEISAKPPGKQMRSITLLSGGEKCLTAVALLFAIFEVKPAPFCILDEIDAPLDDTNVDRFVNVVKHFVNRCQFLIITHNKRTMAMGDVLFGVSMEEKGVSKLLSLEFSHKGSFEDSPEASLV